MSIVRNNYYYLTVEKKKNIIMEGEIEIKSAMQYKRERETARAIIPPWYTLAKFIL